MWAVHFTLDRQCDRLWLYQPPAEGTQEGEKGMSEGAGTRRNGVKARAAKRHCALQPGSFIAGVRRAQATARQRGAAGTAAASVGIASGMETRWPERPGQRQPGWLCAEHDSPPGRPVPARKDTGDHAPRKENYFFLLASAISAYRGSPARGS